MQKIENQTETIMKICNGQQWPCWTLTIYAIIIALVTIIGILLNLALVFVTIRTKSFRGIVNILLAFYSVCEIVHICGNFLSIFTAFSGQYFIAFKTGIYFVTAPLIGAGCAVNLMFFIGIERLFVVFSLLKKFNNQFSLIIVFVLNVMHSVVSAFIYLKCYNAEMDTFKIFANYYEIIQLVFKTNRCSPILLPEGTTIIVCSVIIYALIAVKIQCRKVPSNTNSAQFNNRIFRSLFSIVFFNIGGYIITSIYLLIVKSINNDNLNNAIISWHVLQIVGILGSINAASSGPILYLTSSEYRAAFQKEFSFLFVFLQIVLYE